MLDLKALNRAIETIAQEKGIDAGAIFGAIEAALAAAYRKEYRKKGELIKCKLNPKTGDMKFSQVKLVADENSVRVKEELEQGEVEKERVESEEELLPVYNPDRHIWLKEAKEIKKGVEVGEELEFPLEDQSDFGRIASQAAKQVILQKIREIERDSVKKEYIGKEGEIVSGTVQRVERGNIYVDLGRASGIMFYTESIPGEHYRIGERLKFYLLAVQDETRVPGLILSRSHPKFVSKLFEMEVPEIHNELVEIKAVAREAGSRTKIAADSKVEGVDPIGSLVGQRGTRVMAVTNELGNEKIDIIGWSEAPDKFIAAALSPAKVVSVEVLPRREARVMVPEDQLSLAIGKGGQNVRLAAKLTGWKIDVRSDSRPDVVQFDPGKINIENAAVEETKKEKDEHERVD
ncbi:transcription termination/antitermination protein NusA [Candidatus Wolfebacteria bacterium]|uniref:Transcription termination/antitermination protein NusA n=1 Tax=Candidatus Wolfebacteria bacterium CG_4_10_14_0_2_um_filter_39_18 TaxID=1975061 RepID=A0A2M7TGR4_9BACT|nr:transcription termination/antitermination protein NusA [Candidatus Wolfebacteria bacterium]PIZ45334.1 MAG: transcription termination/antitermination protein NusA [Candidatus Wolfebacteria bacterium CG_4_10_14_0_2_um_filter_39_18]